MSRNFILSALLLGAGLLLPSSVQAGPTDELFLTLNLPGGGHVYHTLTSNSLNTMRAAIGGVYGASAQIWMYTAPIGGTTYNENNWPVCGAVANLAFDSPTNEPNDMGWMNGSASVIQPPSPSGLYFYPSGTPGDVYYFVWADTNGGSCTGSTQVGYFKWHYDGDTSTTPPETFPPTTDFNEVLNYIPDTGVATSTGTTHVGAEFSIPYPEYIEYIGYRILSPSNEVLYNATSSTPTAALYEISTDYNFSVPGIYQGHAYFAQDFGGNIWEVDNPTIQQIVVDVPEWTISPDGGFSQNPATTSTTTLPNLTLDCGTGFVSSICNLVARLVVPSATSIGLVQAQWSTVLSKAPFSFFTESRAVLDAVRVSSGDQQTLNLNLFNTTIPVITSSTTAAIGLDTTQINFLKFLMIVGLWILFAWFLYWRIASIFGV